MSAKAAAYTKGEIGEVQSVEDFLPPPDQLALPALMDRYASRRK